MTDRPLPPHVRRDLDRAARGEGRTPTAAHPDCCCGKKVGEVGGRAVYGRREDCPQHRPEPRP